MDTNEKWIMIKWRPTEDQAREKLRAVNNHIAPAENGFLFRWGPSQSYCYTINDRYVGFLLCLIRCLQHASRFIFHATCIAPVPSKSYASDQELRTRWAIIVFWGTHRGTLERRERRTSHRTKWSLSFVLRPTSLLIGASKYDPDYG